MTRVCPSIAVIFFSMLLLISCNDDNTVNNETVYDDEPVEVIFGEQQINLSSEDYEALTEEALHILRVQKPHFQEEEQRKWFIRYYIRNYEYNENNTNEQIFQLADARFKFEQAWKDYAYEEYSISVTEENIENQAEYNVEVYQQNIPPSIIGMSEGLDLSIEEFMAEFDRDYVTRTVIWRELMPILFEKHQAEASDRLDGVYLSQRYEEEVLEFVEQQENES